MTAFIGAASTPHCLVLRLGRTKTVTRSIMRSEASRRLFTGSRIILTAMAKDPAGRHESAAESKQPETEDPRLHGGLAFHFRRSAGR